MADDPVCEPGPAGSPADGDGALFARPRAAPSVARQPGGSIGRADARCLAAAVVGVGLLLAFLSAMALLQRAPVVPSRTERAPLPSIPETALPSVAGPRVINVPDRYSASLYRSPSDGGLLAEWPGGTAVAALGLRFFDGYTDWELVRDPRGDAGWLAALFLAEEYTAADPPTPEDHDYVGAVRWAGEIAICVNPAGGPPGLDGDAFVRLVERAAARWQALVDGILPLASHGRCASSPETRGDGVSAVGWAADLGLVIAGQAWPDADSGVVREIDVRLSRGYFERLQARDPSKTLQVCVFSTVVHELGHVLGLDHPRSRAVPSSMQAVGASRCDKGQPTELDRANLLRLYPASGAGRP